MSRPALPPPRGVSLVEALVALAVMAFGMLAVAGIQGMLRLNSDVAKQRSEAVRIAQENIETWRRFSVRTIEAGAPPAAAAWSDIASAAGVGVTGYTTNTSYTLNRVVTESPQGYKTLRVTVSWPDRTGAVQAVELNTVISAAEPAVAGTLAIRPVSPDALRPGGRHAGIPWLARELGDGRSVFKPAGEGTVAWVFDNVSGLITSVCTVAAGSTTGSLTAADLGTCTSASARLLTGVVRFASTAGQPSAAQAENPTGPVLNLQMSLGITGQAPASPVVTTNCYDDAPDTAARAAGRLYVTYYCAIFAVADQTWSGFAWVIPQPFGDAPSTAWELGTGAGRYRVCRYTTLAGDTGRNADHPRVYLDVGPTVLANQNYLVISGQHDCPTDTAVDVPAGNLVNSNTRLHQPPSTPSIP